MASPEKGKPSGGGGSSAHYGGGGTELEMLETLLDEERDSNKYLGDTMFWREYEFINAKNILRSSSIEYSR